MKRSATGTFVMQDGDSAVVVDDRSSPVIFATWFGEATESLVERYFACQNELLENALSHRTRLVIVTDTFAARRPTPKARKLIADLTAAQPPRVVQATLISLVVIESALIRGVVTALAWIHPAMADAKNVASIRVAVEDALAALDGAGIRRPAGLTPTSYVRPTAP